jgi:acyl carrier protein
MDIQQQIKQFIIENFLFAEDGYELGNDTSFMDEGIVDSMGTLELILFIEETFQITVEDDEIEPDNLDSVKNLCQFITRKSEETLVTA